MPNWHFKLPYRTIIFLSFQNPCFHFTLFFSFCLLQMCIYHNEVAIHDLIAFISSVLHANKPSGNVSDDVTIPTSHSVSKEKEKDVVEELNIHIKVQELASRMIDMKKQKRRIDKFIQKTESKLVEIYAQAGIDCLEAEMGLLSRRKKDRNSQFICLILSFFNSI